MTRDFGLAMILDALFAADTPPQRIDLSDLVSARGVDDLVGVGASPATG